MFIGCAEKAGHAMSFYRPRREIGTRVDILYRLRNTFDSSVILVGISVIWVREMHKNEDEVQKKEEKRKLFK